MREPVVIELRERVDVSDVTPDTLLAYLDGRGYVATREWRGAPVYEVGPCEVLAPPFALADWPGRIAEAVRAIAVGESTPGAYRSPLAVLADMRAAYVRALLIERGLPVYDDNEESEDAPVADPTIDGGVDVYLPPRRPGGPRASFCWGSDLTPHTDWRAWADDVAARWRGAR